MSFNHASVSAIEAATAKVIEVAAAKIDTVTEEQTETLKARTRMVDGVRITKEAYDLVEAFRKIHRTAKFGVTRDCEKVWVDTVTTFCSVWAYLPGHEYAMCRLGYGDVTINHSGYKYFVYARTIRNEKFGDDRKQYNMAMSDSFDRAIKNIKKYVRPYSPTEIAGMTYDSFQQRVSNTAWQISSALNDARGKLFNDSESLRSELFAMLESGYQFNNPILRERISEWRDKYDDAMEKSARAVHAYHVRLRQHGDEQLFDIIEVFDVKSSSIKGEARVQTFKHEDLPEDIAGKLASLSMLEDGGYVEGLGMKVNATTYWVERG